MVDYNIIKEIIEKCSKPHISSLPYDNRYSDHDKLNERRDVIRDRINETEVDINENTKNLNMIYGALESNRRSLVDNAELMMDSVFNGFNGVGFLLNTDNIKRTRGEWESMGYASEFDKLMSVLPRVYQNVQVLSHSMKNAYEDGVIQDNLYSGEDIYKDTGLVNRFTQLQKDIPKLKELLNNNYPYNNIDDATKYMDNLEEMINVMSNHYMDYQKTIETQNSSVNVRTDLLDELDKVDDKL